MDSVSMSATTVYKVHKAPNVLRLWRAAAARTTAVVAQLRPILSNAAISPFVPLTLKLTKLSLSASMSATTVVNRSPSKTSGHRDMVPLMVKVGSGMSSPTISPSVQGKPSVLAPPDHLSGKEHGASSMFRLKTRTGTGTICQRMAMCKLNALTSPRLPARLICGRRRTCRSGRLTLW